MEMSKILRRALFFIAASSARRGSVRAARCAIRRRASENVQLRGRSDNSALGCAGRRIMQIPAFQHAGMQPLPNEPQQHSIVHPPTKDLDQVFVVQSVEEFSNINLQHPSTRFLQRLVPQSFERHVRRASGAEAIRAIEKVLLVDGFEHHRHGALKNLVLKGRDAQRSGFRTAVLRDIDPPHGWRAVRAGLRAVEQRLEVFFQVRCIFGRALPVHACGPALARASIRFV